MQWLAQYLFLFSREILGFCFGVRRAVDLAKKALVENNQKKVYSLGPLIHNEFVLDNLKTTDLSQEYLFINGLKFISSGVSICD